MPYTFSVAYIFFIFHVARRNDFMIFLPGIPSFLLASWIMQDSHILIVERNFLTIFFTNPIDSFVFLFKNEAIWFIQILRAAYRRIQLGLRCNLNFPGKQLFLEITYPKKNV